MMYHVINVAAFRIESSDCPGSDNKIVGRFLGWGWDAAQVQFGTDLNNSRTGGGVGVRMGP